MFTTAALDTMHDVTLLLIPITTVFLYCNFSELTTYID